MRTAELTVGRRLALALEPGDDVLASVEAACRDHGISQGVVVSCTGAFRKVRLIATAGEAGPDQETPMTDHVDVAYLEGIGSGTVVSSADGAMSVHLHVAAGVRADAGRACAGHLLAGEAQYVVEIVIDEVLDPPMDRVATADTYGVPAWTFMDAAAR